MGIICENFSVGSGMTLYSTYMAYVMQSRGITVKFMPCSRSHFGTYNILNRVSFPLKHVYKDKSEALRMDMLSKWRHINILKVPLECDIYYNGRKIN